MRDPNPSFEIGRLKRRADFLHVAKGKRFHVGAMSIQAAPRDDVSVQTSPRDGVGVRLGFTLTRKVGNAVIRNRARRRLKEALRLSPGLPVVANHDYVIVGRIEALSLPFETLKRDLARAIRGVHESGKPGRQRSKRPDPIKTSQNQPSLTQPSHEIRPKRTRPEP